MIIIYTQEKTFIRDDADSAKNLLIAVYGDKLGKEAFVTVKNGRSGVLFRKNGGPLVRIVTKEEAEEICKKEKSIGMM